MRLMAVGFIPLVAACYLQSPLMSPTPAPDMRIVAQVTDTGVLEMGQAIGPGATEVEGVVANADATAWDLRMLRVDYRGGSSVLWKGELVHFPRSALSQATERRFSRGRSWVLAGVITSTALLAARFLGFLGGGDSTDKPPPPPN
ncbi:MAG TPA: hypothetical protein VL549_12285 [Gemmatimonadales bacterium]|nr:hypothetical protein [Gemmatimonadales bacterium]